jgi:hypothetical protein
MEVVMLLSIIILILLTPVAILPLVLRTSFSSNELQEMGVYLENPTITPSDDHICQQKHMTPKMQVACGNS